MKPIKLWICRTPVEYLEENSIEEICKIQNFLERYPDKKYLYTKLYICYEKPESHDLYCNTVRKVQISNYIYKDIQPGQVVEIQSV